MNLNYIYDEEIKQVNFIKDLNFFYVQILSYDNEIISIKKIINTYILKNPNDNSCAVEIEYKTKDNNSKLFMFEVNSNKFNFDKFNKNVFFKLTDQKDFDDFVFRIQEENKKFNLFFIVNKDSENERIIEKFDVDFLKMERKRMKIRHQTSAK